MNPRKELSKEQQRLLEDAEIKIQEKDYTEEEVKLLENDIIDYIMNKSFKHKNISKIINSYLEVINKVDKSTSNVNRIFGHQKIEKTVNVYLKNVKNT